MFNTKLIRDFYWKHCKCETDLNDFSENTFYSFSISEREHAYVKVKDTCRKLILDKLDDRL